MGDFLSFSLLRIVVEWIPFSTFLFQFFFHPLFVLISADDGGDNEQQKWWQKFIWYPTVNCIHFGSILFHADSTAENSE